MDSHGCYVYGITRRVDTLPLAEKGIDPACPVYALPYENVQAIVSEVSLAEFGVEVLEANVQDLQWLAARVRAHESILEAILPHCTLIPMRFCTIFLSESRVREMLAECHDGYINTLTRLDGRKEWGVKVYVDRAIISQRVGDISDKVKKLEMEMAEKSGGAAYLWKKRLDEAVAVEADRVSIEVVERSHELLSGHAEESVANPLQSRESAEEMILNGAYLVADERLAAFQAELAGLDDEYVALGFGFRESGPWPPYNFVANERTRERS